MCLFVLFFSHLISVHLYVFLVTILTSTLSISNSHHLSISVILFPFSPNTILYTSHHTILYTSHHTILYTSHHTILYTSHHTILYTSHHTILYTSHALIRLECLTILDKPHTTPLILFHLTHTSHHHQRIYHTHILHAHTTHTIYTTGAKVADYFLLKTKSSYLLIPALFTLPAALFLILAGMYVLTFNIICIFRLNGIRKV